MPTVDITMIPFDENCYKEKQTENTLLILFYLLKESWNAIYLQNNQNASNSSNMTCFKLYSATS